MLSLDHLVVVTSDLDRGAAEIEARVGQPLEPGGKHAAMGTHNRLLSLGSDCYLEVIAIDPAAPAPDQPRWFALDTRAGPTALTHWAARCDDLDAALSSAPDGTGRAWDLSRGDLRWRMAIPTTGQTPFDGAFPALLEWITPNPAPRLPDRGLRVIALRVESPQAPELNRYLGPMMTDARVSVVIGSAPRVSATLQTPAGVITI